MGNSKGIIIPKAVLKQCHFEKAIDMQVVDGSLVIRPVVANPRAGWEEAFLKAKREEGEDPLTEEWLSFPNEFDDKEWEW